MCVNRLDTGTMMPYLTCMATTTAHKEQAMTTTATAVYIQADIAIDDTGDEIDAFAVFAGDDYAEPINTVITCYNETIAWDIATNIAKSFNIEIVGPRD